jgi:bifunctional enzyme CysN/CysC
MALEIPAFDRPAPIAPAGDGPREDGRISMNIVIVGHVDHGKSTVVGRLLADTGSLPEGKLDAVRAYCERNSRPFEYAFLLDALKDEQAQGITIDTARTFFKSGQRDYIIIDAPGHIEFLKNMVTGAARAEAAVLVIDAKEGIRENSKRHGYLMAMLGIKQIAVVVNKMDLVGYSKEAFEDIRDEYISFLARIGAAPKFFLPVAAFHGENLVRPSDKMPWYTGHNLLSAVDAFKKEPPKSDQPFRMPVQDVYKFTALGDDRRIAAGRVESGSAKVGDEVVFLPSGKKSRIKSIEAFHAPVRREVGAGVSTGFTLEEQIYVGRGELMAKTGEVPPEVGRRLRVNLFWMGKKPFERGRTYFLKLGTAKIPVRLSKINVLIDASETAGEQVKTSVGRHDVADCVIELSKPLAFDPTSRLEATGRFVIVDQYEIAGGGIIRESLPEIETSGDGEKARAFARSGLPYAERAKALGQKAALVLVSGGPSRDASAAGQALERKLLSLGRPAFYLGLEESGEGAVGWEGTGLAGRLGEAAGLLLDAGLILVVATKGLETQDIKTLESQVAPHPLLEVEPSSDTGETLDGRDGIVDEAVARLRKLGAF